jgi:DNA polymerase III alpha subunit
LPKLSKTIVTNLILVGAFDHLKYSRTKLVYEYNLISQLTDKEINQLLLCHHSAEPIITRLCNIKVSKPRQKIVNSIIESFKNPTASLEDNLVWLNKTEEDLLGIPLSVTKLDTCEIMEADTSCKEFKDGKDGKVVLSVEIIQTKEITTKGKNAGQKMGFLSVEDSTGILDDITIFPDIWSEYKNILYKGNTIVIHGYKSKKNSLILQKAHQI